MTSQQAAESRAPEDAFTEEQIAAYLEAHSDFFKRHLDLVANLQVPHASGNAVSLIEHQVGVLRGQLQTERRRLAHLIARARDFENLSARLHSLSLHLIAARDLEHLQTLLRETLCREFDAAAVTLKLFPIDPDAADSDPDLSAFLGFFDREHSLCGSLDAERSAVLFGEQSEAVRSAALIPVSTNGRRGVLAIGSEDPERFGVDMGTDLLDRLGEIVSHKLRSLNEADV